MFKFNPKTQEEIDALSNGKLLSKGEYEFKIISVEEKISSKSMNEMLVVKLMVIQGNDSRVIKDHIVLTDGWAYKFKHFCESLGLHKAYEKGELNLSSLNNMLGVVKLDIEKGEMKKDGSNEFFPDKNKVVDYVPSAIAKEIKEIFNDDIPF